MTYEQKREMFEWVLVHEPYRIVHLATDNGQNVCGAMVHGGIPTTGTVYQCLNCLRAR